VVDDEKGGHAQSIMASSRLDLNRDVDVKGSKSCK
jgi:hypothetical protein